MSNTATQNPSANVSNNVDTDFSRRRPGRHHKKKDVKTPGPRGRPRQYEDVPSKYQIRHANTIIYKPFHIFLSYKN